MSLINDALNRARTETAQREAENRGEVVPGVALPQQRTSYRQRLLLAAIVVVIVLAIFWVRREQSPHPLSANADRAESPAEITTSPTEMASTRATLSTTAPDASTASSTPSTASTSGPPATPGPALPGNDAPPQRTTGNSQPTSAQAVTTPDIVVPSTIREPIADPPNTALTATAEAEETTTPTPSRPAVIWPTDSDADETWYYVGTAGLPGGATIELGGIAWSPSAPSAILNGALVTVGDEILGLRVEQIARRTVILTGHGLRIALQLGSNS